VQLAFEDPALRQVFTRILSDRPPGFDERYVGQTLSSAEIASLPPKLIERLMEMPKREAEACLARLSARVGIAAPMWSSEGAKQPLGLRGVEQRDGGRARSRPVQFRSILRATRLLRRRAVHSTPSSTASE